MNTYTYNGHTYLLSDIGTWTQAETQAVSLGGHLVTVNDQTENNWLVTTFGSERLWIGYTDQVQEGLWKWIDGNNSVYTNWSSGEPNNMHTEKNNGIGEDYAVMNWNAGGFWNDWRNTADDGIGTSGIIEISHDNNISWTNWSTNNGSASSESGTTLQNGTIIDVSYSGEHVAVDHAVYPYPSLINYQVPNLSDSNGLLKLYGGSASVHTIHFSQPVTNPLIEIISLGRPSVQAQINFIDNPQLNIISQGGGYWGGDDHSLTQNGSFITGNEGSGVLSFEGTYQDIRFTTPNYEEWYGISVGLYINASSSPNMLTTTPADNATAISPDSNIVLTFNEPVKAGTGNIIISNGTDIRSIPVTDTNQITISGNTVTINPAANLLGGYSYNVQMASGVITDLTNNPYAGIADATTLNFSTQNTPPTAQNKTLTLNEDSIRAFSAADFGYSDTDGQPMASVKILSLPAQGQLKLNGAAVTANQIIPTASLAQLSFTPEPNASGNNYASFNFSVNDGINNSLSANTLSLNVTAVNDAPAFTDVPALFDDGTEDTPYTITQDSLLTGFTDAENDVLSISSLTASQGSLAAFNAATKSWTFTPTANANGLVTLNYTVSDGNGGNTAASRSFNLTPVNDAPTGAVTVSGNPINSQLLTTSNNLADADGLGVLNYQWLANGIAIPGANASSYTLTANEIGKSVFVVASYLDGGGRFEIVPSVATAKVGNNLTGTLNAETINGTVGADNISGLAGNDTLNSLAGNDVINGNDGNDLMLGGAGIDTMNGGTGSDTYEVTENSDFVFENANEGTDSVWSHVSSYTLPANVENLYLGAGATNGRAIGNGLANQINGNTGNNMLIGFAGNDTMRGGAGGDTYEVTEIGDQVIENSNEGIDSVWSHITNYTLPANVENLFLGGTVNRDGAGNGLNNLLTGNAAINKLDGGAGNDTIDSAAGNDNVTGGTGQDIFRLMTATGIDTITDFSPVDDTIQLKGTVFTALGAAGTLTASKFKIAAASQDADDFIVYNNASGAIYYDADGNGTGAAVQIATVGFNLALTNADFVVI